MYKPTTPLGRYEFLDEHAILRPDDLVRNLMPLDHDWGPDLYSGHPYDWFRADEQLSGWIGKTLHDFHCFKFADNYRVPVYFAQYEVMRKID